MVTQQIGSIFKTTQHVKLAINYLITTAKWFFINKSMYDPTFPLISCLFVCFADVVLVNPQTHKQREKQIYKNSGKDMH